MNMPAPFSKRQQEYMYRCFDSWFNVAEGGKRGGKNVLQTLIFCMMIEQHKNRMFLIGGVSSATARLNILDCDGYGLLNYFEGRCREGKYQNRECVYVNTANGQKIVLVSGGGKDGDEKLVKGNSYGMAYITEANECHPKFLKEVFDRTLSSSDRKVFHDLNPKEEEHWYYEEILNFHERQQVQDPEYGYNYGHFTIVDNYSVSDEELRAKLKTYDKDTVWYRRDIRGERAVAEGIIFRRFADNNEPYLYDEEELFEEYEEGGIRKQRLRQKPYKIVIGSDLGGNGSMTTFVATAYFNKYHDLRAVEEECIPLSPDIDADKICETFVRFYAMVIQKYGKVDHVLPDCAATTMINSMKSAAKKAGLPHRNIKGCRKNEVEERPKMVDLLFNTGRLKISRRCMKLCKAIGTLKWDEDHPDRPEDKNIGNCNDWWDGFCYTMLDFVELIGLDR
mgnify:CR=1 FL=1